MRRRILRGRSNKRIDRSRVAKRPGMRRAKVSKKVYYEYRRNRADLSRKRRL